MYAYNYTSASRNPTEVTCAKFGSVSDFNTESHFDHDESSQTKRLLKLMYLMNLDTYLLKLEGLLGLLKAFHQLDMGQLLPIR